MTAADVLLWLAALVLGAVSMVLEAQAIAAERDRWRTGADCDRIFGGHEVPERRAVPHRRKERGQ